MLDAKKLLAQVHHRPMMFWGASDHPFTSLIAFVEGVHVGGGVRIVPGEFHQFVAQHFGENWPSPKGWMSFIREHTISENEAFELFFELLEQYEDSNQ